MGSSGHRSGVQAVVARARRIGAVGAAVAALAATLGCSGDDDEPAAPDSTEDRCDLGFNTVAYNDAAAVVDHSEHVHHQPGTPSEFTLEEWAETFTADDLGISTDEVVDAVSADDLYRRMALGGVLAHSLDPDPWMAMTDPAQCDALADQLRAARDVAATYPTVADALAAGYTLGDSYFAGLGVHYQNWELLGSFDAARPVQLLYDGTDAASRLVGLSYVVRQEGDVEPAGFAGDSDSWHRHRAFCLDQADGGVNLASDVLTEAECVALGGTYALNDTGWMLHVWVVPGCESDWGVFSSANPRLPYIPDGASFASGCNSGKTVTDPLALDERGDGPDINAD